MTSLRILVVYHKGCWDGMGAAWAVWRHYKGCARVDLVPATYGNTPPSVADYDRVYVVDFSYPRPILENMQASCPHVVVLDHHDTAQENLAGLAGCHFDMAKSGARLAWEHFSAAPLPWFLAYIEDRDLWAWRLPGTAAFCAWLFAQDMTLETLEDLSRVGQEGETSFLAQGAAIKAYQDQTVAYLADRAHPLRLDTGEGVCEALAVNSPVLQSEVGHALGQGRVAVVYSVARDHVRFSLRADSGLVDVARIAHAFGGGGHPKAAGFSLPLAPALEGIAQGILIAPRA